MTTKQYHGSCICGSIKFEADVESSDVSNRCNCTTCRKTRFWFIRIKPDNFRLLTSEDALNDYVYKSGYHQLFCKTCGVHAFGKLNKPGVGDFVSINVSCLDGLSSEELSEFKIKYMDGLNDQWWVEPEDKHLL